MCDIVEKTDAVNTSNMDACNEQHFLMHVPLDIYDSVSVAGLQSDSDETVALMNADISTLIDISENIVSRNHIAA